MLHILSNPRARADISAIIWDSRPWRALAAADIRSKYRRTTLGPFWMTISMGTTAVAIGVIYGQFFGQDVRTYLPYFSAGLIIWTFIASSVTESSTVLIGASTIIKASNLPISFHVMRMIQRNLVLFLHNMLVLVIMWPFVRWSVSFDALLAIPGLLLLFVFLSAVSIITSFVCIRYRDVPPMIQAVTQFLFFASPVIWYTESLKFGQVILQVNPIAFFLNITRDPLVGRPVDPQNWLLAGVATALAVVIALMVYNRYRDRVSYWV